MSSACHPHIVWKRARCSHGTTALYKVYWLPCWCIWTHSLCLRHYSSFSQTIRKCQLWHFCLYYVKTKKKYSDKILPLAGIEPGLLIASDSQVQHYPFYTNLTCACKTETLGSLYSHALLIPLKSI